MTKMEPVETAFEGQFSAFPHGSNHEGIAPILSCVLSGPPLVCLGRSEEKPTYNHKT